MGRTIDQKMKYESKDFERYLKGRRNCKRGRVAYMNVQKEVIPVLEILNSKYDDETDEFIKKKRTEIKHLIREVDERIYGCGSEMLNSNEAEILAECVYILRKTAGYMYEEIERRSGKRNNCYCANLFA